MKLIAVIGFFIGVIILGSCKKENPAPLNAVPSLPDVPYEYFASENANHQATLGRVLFYDKMLSINGTISCGTCHLQAAGFADNNVFSRGFENRLASRNTPGILNLGFSRELFWDGRETKLNEMVLKPILNHVEMGMQDMDALVARIAAAPYYKPLFEKAFGHTNVSAHEVGIALSKFVSSIALDEQVVPHLLVPISQEPNSIVGYGRLLFEETYNCGSCHRPGQGVGYVGEGSSVVFSNIGLDESYADNGRGKVTMDHNDDGKFKIPNLLNVSLTAPYMHDGRFKTLDEVLDHYSHGISNHPNLDHRLKNFNGSPAGFALPDADRKALIAFLESLKTPELLTAVKFSDPFVFK